VQSGEKKNVIGAQVKHLRKKQNLSQEELVARCGVLEFELGQPAVSQIENGMRGISDLEMILLATALRVEISELIPDDLPKWKKDTRPPNQWN